MHDPDKADATARLAELERENALLRAELALARERLVSSDEHLRQLFEAAPLAYQSLDPRGRLRAVSQGWLDLFGCERREVEGRTLHEFFAPEEREALLAHFSKLVSSGWGAHYEGTALRKNGERFGVSMDGMVVRDADGGFLRTHCLLRDVSAERAARASLARSEEFYRTVFDNAAMPIAMARGLTCLYANRAMAQALRLPDPSLLLGASVQDHIAPEDRDAFLDRNRRRLAGEAVPDQYEINVLRADGTTFPAFACVCLVELPDGPASIGYFLDFTQQKRIADSLKRSEARFRSLFDAVPSIAVQGYDENRTVIYWNAASEALYGYRRDEALGRKLEDLIVPPPLRPFVIADIRAWVENGVAIPPGELELTRKDGSRVHVFSSHVMLETGESGHELYCLDVDLSELHAAKQELTRARDEARAASTAKSEFLANMSHEVRTPLNGVLGMLQLLMADGLEGEQREFLELAYESSRRLLSLLNDILDFSRIESGRLVLQSAPLDPRELLESVLRVFALSAERRGLRLALELDPALPERIVGDEARLRQILFNLVGNAVKFTRAGDVRLEAWTTPDTRRGAPPGGLLLRLCVADTGVGIPADKIPYVFERFTQTDSSYTRQYEGAGLGLAIVKRIVQLMDGFIVVDSEPMNGTTVCVSLPVLPLSCALPVQHEYPCLQTTLTQPSLSVLVAEDDRISLMFLRRQLARMGHRVETAPDGRQALEALREQTYDCVLMDVQMPVLDGLSATRAIRELDAHLGRERTWIVAMTAYALAGDREKFLAGGMDDYLSKPLQQPDLERALENARQRKVPPT